jgi:hypothetical protein
MLATWLNLGALQKLQGIWVYNLLKTLKVHMHMEVELEVLAAIGKFVENLLHVRKEDLEEKKNSLFYMLSKQETITFRF